MGSIVQWDTLDTKLAFSHLWRLLLPGACFVERHITLDRAMYGSDQAASVEIHALANLVKVLRAVPAILGNGEKVIGEAELATRDKLRVDVED